MKKQIGRLERLAMVTWRRGLVVLIGCYAWFLIWLEHLMDVLTFCAFSQVYPMERPSWKFEVWIGHLDGKLKDKIRDLTGKISQKR